jgi:hypothetical protein
VLNPDDLDPLLASLRADAAALTDLGHHLADQRGLTDWTGPGAGRFADRDAARQAEIAARVSGLEELAATVRQLQADIQRELDVLRDLERQVRTWFDDLRRRGQVLEQQMASAGGGLLHALGAAATGHLGTAVHDAAGTVGAVVGAGEDLAALVTSGFAGWAWRPDNLPARGDAAWHAVALFAHSKGMPG